MDYSTDDALSAIRLRAFLPLADSVWTDNNILFILNEELQAWAVPFLQEVRSEYFQNHLDVVVNPGQTVYPIPPQAIGGVLRDVQMLDLQGNLWPLIQLDVRELGPFTTGNPWGFFIEGDNLVLAQNPSNPSWLLRMRYGQRPSVCVTKANAAQVATISGNVVTFTGTVPMSPNTAVDWLKGGSSYQTQSTTVLPTPSGSNYTFTSLPNNLLVGDWLAPSGQSPFPQIPIEAHPVLHQRVASKILDMLGDDKAAQSLNLFKEMAVNVQKILAPRVQGSIKALRGTLSRGFGKRWGGYWFGS